MTRFVTDTHALLWHIMNDRRLSVAAKRIFSEADSGLHQILIPSIVLVEAIYLAEKNRIDSAAVNRLFSLLDLAPVNYDVVPLNIELVRTLMRVDRERVTDMPDRIIVATARYLGVELITRDRGIIVSGVVNTIW